MGSDLLTCSSCATSSKLFGVLGLNYEIEKNRASEMAPWIGGSLAPNLSSVPRAPVVEGGTHSARLSSDLVHMCAHTEKMKSFKLGNMLTLLLCVCCWLLLMLLPGA